MIQNFLVLVFLFVGIIDASSLDLSGIENCRKRRFDDGMPNITYSTNTARPIGTRPKSNEVAVTVASSITAAPAVTFIPPPPPLISTISDKISIASEQTFKRSRIDNHTYEQDLEKYIEAELAFNGFKKVEKREALRRVIELIASNDHDGFLEYESTFEASFGNAYHTFKRGPKRAEYMMHYIIRFGATKLLFFHCYTGRPSNEDSNIEGAFEHLIATKPLDIVFQFLNLRKHLGKESVSQAISNAVKKRYPELHFLDYVVFEITTKHFDITLYPLAFKIFESKSEAKKFACLTRLLTEMVNLPIDFQAQASNARFLQIPFIYPDYFMSLDIDLKFLLAQMAVNRENSVALTRMIDLYPDLVLHISKEGSLFTFAAENRVTGMFKFLMDVIPELATLEIRGKSSPVIQSIYRNFVTNLIAFDECGFDFTQPIPHLGNLKTPIQLAFNFKIPPCFDYFVDKFGPAYAIEQISTEFLDKDHIMRHARHTQLVNILSTKLGIN